MSEDPKNFLNAWLGKNKHGSPVYNVRQSGPKHRQRFLCELNAGGIPYVACGNSTNKKDSMTNAAKDFLSYLVRQSILRNSDLPADMMTSPGEGTSGSSLGLGAPSGSNSSSSSSVFQQGYGPDSMGQAYRAAGHEGATDRFNPVMEAANKRRVEEAEDVDINAGTSGSRESRRPTLPARKAFSLFFFHPADPRGIT